ncbi:MAG: F0F1 ATP synthase subunit A [Candidatus Sumerlaeaceae bacterium]
MQTYLRVLLLAITCTLASFTFAQEQVAPAAHRAEAAATHDAAAKHEPAAAGHGAEKHEESAAAELPNFIHIALATTSQEFRHSPLGHFIHTWTKQIFLVINSLIGLFILTRASRLRSLVPGKFQTTLEMIYEGFRGFIVGILGEDNAKYVPFLGSVFLFIFINNIFGLIPFFAAGTSVYPTTLALALMIFVYVQFNSIREGGLKHWAMHFLGSPKDMAGLIIGICLLPLEIIGTLAKPLSLSLRLFGNIMGEDILIGVFLLLGLTMAGGLFGVSAPPVGVPLHLPFMFLGIMTCTVQALVFTLLSTIYLMLVLPHEHHDETELHHHDDRKGLYDDDGQHLSAGEISPV